MNVQKIFARDIFIVTVLLSISPQVFSLLTVETYEKTYRTDLDKKIIKRGLTPAVVDTFNVLEKQSGECYAKTFLNNFKGKLSSFDWTENSECFCQLLVQERQHLIEREYNSHQFHQIEEEKAITSPFKTLIGDITAESLRDGKFVFQLADNIRSALQYHTVGEQSLERDKVVKSIIAHCKWILFLCPKTYSREANGLLILLFLIYSPDKKTDLVEQGCLINESDDFLRLLALAFSKEELSKLGEEFGFGQNGVHKIILKLSNLDSRSIHERRSFRGKFSRMTDAKGFPDYLSLEFDCSVTICSGERGGGIVALDSVREIAGPSMEGKKLDGPHRVVDIELSKKDSDEERIPILKKLQKVCFDGGEVSMVLEGSQALRANLMTLYGKNLQKEGGWQKKLNNFEPRDWDFLIRRQDFESVLLALGMEDFLEKIMSGINTEGNSDRFDIGDNIVFHCRGAEKTTCPKSIRLFHRLDGGPLMVDFIFVENFPKNSLINMQGVGDFPIVDIKHFISSTEKMLEKKDLALDKYRDKYQMWLDIDKEYGQEVIDEATLGKVQRILAQIEGLVVTNKTCDRMRAMEIRSKKAYAVCHQKKDDREEGRGEIFLMNQFFKNTRRVSEEDFDSSISLLLTMLNQNSLVDSELRGAVCELLRNVYNYFDFNHMMKKDRVPELFELLGQYIGDDCLCFGGYPLLFILKRDFLGVQAMVDNISDDLEYLKECIRKADEVGYLYGYSTHVQNCAKCCDEVTRKLVSGYFINIVTLIRILKNNIRIIGAECKMEEAEWQRSAVASELLILDERCKDLRKEIDDLKKKERSAGNQAKRQSMIKSRMDETEVYEKGLSENHILFVNKKGELHGGLDNFFQRMIEDLENHIAKDDFAEAVDMIYSRRDTFRSLNCFKEMGMTDAKAEIILGLVVADVLYKHARPFHHIILLEDILRTDNRYALVTHALERLNVIFCDDMRFFYKLKQLLKRGIQGYVPLNG